MAVTSSPADIQLTSEGRAPTTPEWTLTAIGIIINPAISNGADRMEWNGTLDPGDVMVILKDGTVPINGSRAGSKAVRCWKRMPGRIRSYTAKIQVRAIIVQSKSLGMMLIIEAKANDRLFRGYGAIKTKLAVYKTKNQAWKLIHCILMSII